MYVKASTPRGVAGVLFMFFMKHDDMLFCTDKIVLLILLVLLLLGILD